MFWLAMVDGEALCQNESVSLVVKTTLKQVMMTLCEYYAALLHDIAKPSTNVIDPVNGKIGQPGHSRRGTVDI